MRILITGASGAMGYYLAEYIATKQPGHEVYGIGRRFPASVVMQHLFQYDQLDLYWQPNRRIAEYISSVKPDIVFHLAALASVQSSFADPRRFAMNNTEATLNLFEALAQSGIKTTVVLASSSEVYGNVSQWLRPIIETQPFSPVNPYAVTKCCQESYAHYYRNAYPSLKFVITRAFGYINPRREDLVASAIAKQLVECELGKRSEIWHGDLDPVRSFCDVRDIARAYWLAAMCSNGGVYNIGSTMPCSIAHLVSILRSISPAKAEWRQSLQLKRPTDIYYAVPDIFSFHRVSRWEPEITLEKSCIWLMEEMRKTCTSSLPVEPVTSAQS